MPIPFEAVKVGPFRESYSVTKAGDVIVVPTPGHTPGHVSVLVKSDGLSYFLAGDTSYTQDLLLERKADGVSPKSATALKTIDAVLEYARSVPTVYLPSHDSHTVQRLENKQPLDVRA